MLSHLLADIALTAYTNLQPTKAGMTYRYIRAQIAYPATVRTIRIPQASARCNRRIRL